MNWIPLHDRINIFRFQLVLWAKLRTFLNFGDKDWLFIWSGFFRLLYCCENDIQDEDSSPRIPNIIMSHIFCLVWIANPRDIFYHSFWSKADQKHFFSTFSLAFLRFQIIQILFLDVISHNFYWRKSGVISTKTSRDENGNSNNPNNHIPVFDIRLTNI